MRTQLIHTSYTTLAKPTSSTIERSTPAKPTREEIALQVAGPLGGAVNDVLNRLETKAQRSLVSAVIEGRLADRMYFIEACSLQRALDKAKDRSDARLVLIKKICTLLAGDEQALLARSNA